MGAAMGMQLQHAGRKASTSVPWEAFAPVPLPPGLDVIGPGEHPAPEGGYRQQAMAEADMDRSVMTYAEAARRARVHSFFSSLSNHRADEFGGGLENRMRFPLGVIAAVREARPTKSLSPAAYRPPTASANPLRTRWGSRTVSASTWSTALPRNEPAAQGHAGRRRAWLPGAVCRVAARRDRHRHHHGRRPCRFGSGQGQSRSRRHWPADYLPVRTGGRTPRRDVLPGGGWERGRPVRLLAQETPCAGRSGLRHVAGRPHKKAAPPAQGSPCAASRGRAATGRLCQ